MPSWRDYVGGSIAKAKDFAGKTKKGKIEDILPVDVRTKEGDTMQRLCFKVDTCDKLIPINGKAGEAFDKKYGEDFSKWKGKAVSIGATDTGKAGDFRYEWDVKPG